MPTRTWPEALKDANELLRTVLRTNTIAFATEHKLQGWTGGYYLNNAKLRLEAASRLRLNDGDESSPQLEAIQGISLFGTRPHDTWGSLCSQAEKLAETIGCIVQTDTQTAVGRLQDNGDESAKAARRRDLQ